MEFRERMFAKMKERGITSSQFLDTLTEFLCETDGLTNEDLREDLEAEGIDVDKAIKKTQALVTKHLRRYRMKALRDEEGWSLADIGRHYEISRQRVHQILKEFDNVDSAGECTEAAPVGR